MLAVDGVIASLAANFLLCLLSGAGQISERDHVDSVVSLAAIDVDSVCVCADVDRVVAVFSIDPADSPVVSHVDLVVAVSSVDPLNAWSGPVASASDDDIRVAPEVLVEGTGAVLVVAVNVFVTIVIGRCGVVILVPVSSNEILSGFTIVVARVTSSLAVGPVNIVVARAALDNDLVYNLVASPDRIVSFVSIQEFIFVSG